MKKELDEKRSSIGGLYDMTQKRRSERSQPPQISILAPRLSPFAPRLYPLPYFLP
jgi:hypothetical protein